MKKKTNSNDQSVKLTRLASLSGGQAFWLFEGRIGWGSCKLPNNLLAQHCTVLDITVFQVYLDHTEAFWCWSFPWLSHILKKVLLCYNMNPAEFIWNKSLKNVDIIGSSGCVSYMLFRWWAIIDTYAPATVKRMYTFRTYDLNIIKLSVRA